MSTELRPAEEASTLEETQRSSEGSRDGDVLYEERVPARSFEEPSLKDIAVSAALWGAGLSWMVPSLGAMTALFQVVPSHKVNVLGRLYCKGQITLTGSRWRAVVHPDVDPERAYIFAQNHTNHYDHVMLYNATPHFKQGLELKDHFDYPFYGWFMKARGTLPVERGKRGQGAELTARMRTEIDEGRSILAFPEGSRTRDGRVQRFRTGIFHMAQQLGAPIVPVAVTGSFDLMRPGSFVIRPGNQITVYCEKPIETVGLTEEDVPELAKRVRDVVAARVDAYWDEMRASR